MRPLVRVAAAGFCLLWVAACSEPSPPLDAQFLASDLNFTIGGQGIVVPVVAVDLPDHTFDLSGRKSERLEDRFRSQALDPRTPVGIDKLDLEIRQYRYRGDNLDSRLICPLLSRGWSRALCVGTPGGLLRRLPERFTLLDRSKLELLQYHWTVGKERRFDQVKGMALQPDVTEIGCDKESKFCTAAVEVLPGLMAVWTVWSDEQNGVTAQAMAETQGAAIAQFVRRALPPVEDPTLAAAS